MFYLRPIDPHVHLRGSEYGIDFLGMALDDAREVDLAAIAEMPNPTPHLTSVEAIENRYCHVIGRRGKLFCQHLIHPGITNNLRQAKEILGTIMAGQEGYVSDKIFYTHSTGNMGILDPDIQKKLWKMKGEMGYQGVSIGHFEDETVFVGKFNPEKPVSHSLVQSEEAETRQVVKQYELARHFNFIGTFYVAHVSSPTTIDFLLRAKKESPFRIIIETTWHHMLLNHGDYAKHKNRVKMNPPLRSPTSQTKLLCHVIDGNIDVIGTDHAPHPIERKDDIANPPSGIPALPFWPRGIKILHDCMGPCWRGKRRIDEMTFHTANEIFKLGIEPMQTDATYKPELWEKYGYNPFERYGE